MKISHLYVNTLYIVYIGLIFVSVKEKIEALGDFYFFFVSRF